MSIEGNVLTGVWVADILAYKRAAGPWCEIDEIKGMHAGYEAVESFNRIPSAIS